MPIVTYTYTSNRANFPGRSSPGRTGDRPGGRQGRDPHATTSVQMVGPSARSRGPSVRISTNATGKRTSTTLSVRPLGIFQTMRWSESGPLSSLDWTPLNDRPTDSGGVRHFAKLGQGVRYHPKQDSFDSPGDGQRGGYHLAPKNLPEFAAHNDDSEHIASGGGR